MTPTPGWQNFDNSWTVRAANSAALAAIFKAAGLLRGKEPYLAVVREHGIRWADAVRHIPVADNSADVVYTSHMVEHLTREEAASFYAEAKRVLKPGGVLRVAVPNLDYHINLYRDNADPDAFMDGLCVVSEPTRGIVGTLKHSLVGERHHQWMYNGPSMRRALEEASFVDATEYAPGETGIADPGALDLAERAPESVFVEARKA